MFLKSKIIKTGQVTRPVLFLNTNHKTDLPNFPQKVKTCGKIPPFLF